MNSCCHFVSLAIKPIVVADLHTFSPILKTSKFVLMIAKYLLLL